MTRYKEIAPKYIYYSGILMHVTALSMFAFLNTKLFLSPEILPIILVLTFETIWLLYFLFMFLNKMIFLKLDLENRTVLYGNIFMNQEVSFDELKDLKRKRWTKDIAQISLSGKVYNLVAPRIDVDKVKQILHTDA